MRIVAKEDAHNNPGYCCLTHDIDGPFLDVGCWINDITPYAYIAVGMVETMGREVGMVAKQEVDALQEQINVMADELERLRRYADTIEAAKEINERMVAA